MPPKRGKDKKRPEEPATTAVSSSAGRGPDSDSAVSVDGDEHTMVMLDKHSVLVEVDDQVPAEVCYYYLTTHTC